MRRSSQVLLCSLVAFAATVALFGFPSGHALRGVPAPFPVPDVSPQSSYDSLRGRIDAERLRLAGALRAARTGNAQDSILNIARRIFIASVADSLAPRWFGTPWDFNGTTQTPREGSIACGYFVSTLLRDAGLNVERVRMAQQASEKIVKALVSEKEIRRFSNVPLDTFVSAVHSWGEGLYVVGLDYHVGFLYHNGSAVRFIHSSYIPPKHVLSEPAARSAILASSKYRIVGKISAADPLLRTWLQGTKVKTAG